MTSYTETEKNILTLYALTTAGAILSMIPLSLLPYAGLACVTVGFIACYIFRMRNKNNELMVFHTTYLIQTMWWASLILVIGILLFACIIFFNGDLSSIYQLMGDAERGLLPEESDIRAMQGEFVRSNVTLILIAAIFCLLPFPLYILFKTLKGVKILTKKAEI